MSNFGEGYGLTETCAALTVTATHDGVVSALRTLGRSARPPVPVNKQGPRPCAVRPGGHARAIG
jgi:hypothetical protein